MKKFKLRVRMALDICKLHFVYVILNCFKRNLYKNNIWLICEKETEARDNGYHFFKYLREEHPEINANYVITENSADLHKVKKYRNVVKYNSLKHYLYYLAAIVNANSQPFGAAPSNPSLIHRFSYLRRKDQKVVFLQHGIIKDELSHYLDYSRANFDIFVCAATRECEFVRQTYGYPDENALLLGLCRYDNLQRIEKAPKNQILIMPTFRRWLKAKNTAAPATDTEKKQFEKSDFYITYTNLLMSERLNKACENYGYKIVFYPHYALQSYIECFEKCKNDNVIIANRDNFDVQQLLIESKILITDFSSVFFDFAYMEKAEIFFQFDEETFRNSHYKKGYFDYREDAFGPVVTEEDALIDEIELLLKREGRISEFYLQRVNEFFALRDDKNCERTYEAIMKKLQT